MSSIIWFFSFLLFITLGVPIAISLSISAIIAITIMGRVSPQISISLMFASMNSYTLLAVPLFIFAGKLMSLGTMSERIFDFSNSFIGWTQGGAGAVNIVASMIFGGISGSGVADIGALGPLEMDMMSRKGYPKWYSAGLTAISSVCSPIIPPSIILVIYAVLAGVSALKMLVTGIIPGLTIVIAFLILNYILSKINKWQPPMDISFNNIYTQFKRSFFAIMAPIILLAGIFSGYFSPTEVALCTTIYALLVELLIYRGFGKDILPQFARTIIETGKDTGIVMLVIANAAIGGFLLSYDGIPELVKNYIISFTQNPNVVLLIIMIFLLFLGTVMETISILIITVPVFLPLAQSVGIDPLFLGIIMILSCAIGYATPPLGMSLLTLVGIRDDLTVEMVAKGALPFICVMIVIVIICIFFPNFTTFLTQFIK